MEVHSPQSAFAGSPEVRGYVERAQKDFERRQRLFRHQVQKEYSDVELQRMQNELAARRGRSGETGNGLDWVHENPLLAAVIWIFSKVAAGAGTGGDGDTDGNLKRSRSRATLGISSSPRGGAARGLRDQASQRPRGWIDEGAESSTTTTIRYVPLNDEDFHDKYYGTVKENYVHSPLNSPVAFAATEDVTLPGAANEEQGKPSLGLRRYDTMTELPKCGASADEKIPAAPVKEKPNTSGTRFDYFVEIHTPPAVTERYYETEYLAMAERRAKGLPPIPVHRDVAEYFRRVDAGLIAAPTAVPNRMENL